MKIFGIQLGSKTGVELAIDEALILIGEERYDEAARVINDKALAREPNNRRALLHLGLCRMFQNRFDEAEELLTPLTREKYMDSEKATALIALEKTAQLRKEKREQPQ